MDPRKGVSRGCSERGVIELEVQRDRERSESWGWFVDTNKASAERSGSLGMLWGRFGGKLVEQLKLQRVWELSENGSCGLSPKPEKTRESWGSELFVIYGC